jgi:hypothetical protein
MSVADAITTPATMGTKDNITGKAGNVPKKKNVSMTVKKGSSDLIVCVRDTLTAPRDIFVVRKPARCSTDSGSTCCSRHGNQKEVFKKDESSLIVSWS